MISYDNILSVVFFRKYKMNIIFNAKKFDNFYQHCKTTELSETIKNPFTLRKKE